MIEPLQGPRLRPLLRLGRHVRAVARSSSRPTAAGIGDIAIYGQEIEPHHLAAGQDEPRHPRHRRPTSAPQPADSFHNDLHKDLKADFILANPPFNVTDWGGDRLRDDVRWKYGAPPAGNANFAWVQHFIHHLAPQRHRRLRAGQRLDVARNQSGEGEIRKAHRRGRPRGLHGRPARPALLLDADPGLPLVPRPRQATASASEASATAAARPSSSTPASSGRMIDRTHRELTDDDIARIARDLPRLARREGGGQVRRRAGFCKSAPLEEIADHGYVLTPGRYVGAEDVEDDGEPFDEKMKRLTAELAEQFAEGRQLEEEIRANLVALGYEL